MNLNATLFVQSLVFLILAWVTMKFIWPPLIAAIDERRSKIAEGLASAEKGAASLEQAKAAAAEIVKEAHARAGKIVEQANRRSTELIEEARGAAIGEGQRLVSEARQEAALETNRARQQLSKELAGLAAAGAGKLLAREIDARAHADLLDKLAQEIERG
ncbi:MAG TPA: F0F1 ATP synthase subunit B [Steroidobacter sp.]|jgi:F-type H+-transporting ATPase subunit b|nr:F0F1 ATP synthase subunit B [Steroidobacter sp.]